MKQENKQRIEAKDRRQLVLDEFIEALKNVKYNEGCVLDVGCSDDFNKQRIEATGMSWVGMDLIAGKNVHIRGRQEKIPFHDGVITCIFCSHVFEHTINPLRTLREFKRVLRASGLLYLVTPEPNFHQIFTMDLTHRFVFGKNQLISLLQKSGFFVVRQKIEKDREGHNNILMMAVSV